MNRPRDPYPSRVTSCQECHQKKKGCTKEPTGCSGCRSKGILCIYPQSALRERAMKPVPSIDDDRSIHLPAPEAPFPPLALILHALETPVMETCQEGGTLEDPDLMPTFQDFQCVLSFISNHPLATPIMAAMNVNAFILTFFTQPAPLRLVIGAIAAYYSSPIISESDALWFFKRARKAVILASDRPTFSSIQAYFWIHLYAGIMKKEELGLPFLKMAIDFAVISKVDVDPDFQPQLANMNEIQKEERRRIFWSVCFISRVVLSVRSDYALSMLQLDQMKPLQPIIGVFEGMRSCKPVCEVRGFIIAIKRHYDSVPSSIQKILYCSNLQNLHIQFVILLSNIPPSLVLPFDNQLEIMSILLSNTEPVDIHVPSLNLDILACTTLLYRSQLYLSALNKFHPSILAPSTQDIVITAIEQCIIAVKRAKSLVQVLYDMNDINISAHSRFWYPLFELSIVSWFIVCRMDKAWSEFVPIEVSELVAASELFADLAIKSMNELDISLPISTALTIMMQEMKVSVDQGQNIRPSASTGTALSNKWEVGLDGSYFGYLGLMGLEVGGMAWKGKNEAEWKQFWKQNGIKQ